MQVSGIDHVVFIVEDIERTVEFYTTILNMDEQTEALTSLHFGTQKINLHPTDTGHDLEGVNDRPGTNDICLLTDVPISEVVSRLENHDVAVVEGPVERTGAVSELLSVYIRDPDGNLIEIANEID